jgi:hypothetical protein
LLLTQVILLAALAACFLFFHSELAALLGRHKAAEGPRWREVRGGPGFWASALWLLLLCSWPVGTLIALFGWRPEEKAGGTFCAECGHCRPEHFCSCRWHEGRAALRSALDHLRGVRAAVEAGELAVVPEPLYADAGRALRAYEEDGPTPAVVSSVEGVVRRLGAVREELLRELRRRQAAGVPDVAWRDRRGEPWAPGLRPLRTARRERPRRAGR